MFGSVSLARKCIFPAVVVDVVVWWRWFQLQQNNVRLFACEPPVFKFLFGSSSVHEKLPRYGMLAIPPRPHPFLDKQRGGGRGLLSDESI